jgi:ATP-dependent DNA helicase PIF1
VINDGEDFVEVPAQFIHNGSVEELLEFTQPRLREGDFDAESAVLTPTNASAEKVNYLALDMLGGNSITLYSTDYLHDDLDGSRSAMITTEFLNSLNVSGLPPHELKLREGVPIILLRNLNPRKGLCNGTRLKVVQLLNNILIAQVISGPAAGKRVCIPRIPMTTTDPIEFTRRQFPVRLAFALTINKAQGQTLNRVAVYLPSPVFSHGQLYVALSRTGDPYKIRIMIDDVPGRQGKVMIQGVERVFTKNVVYKEVFNNLSH